METSCVRVAFLAISLLLGAGCANSVSHSGFERAQRSIDRAEAEVARMVSDEPRAESMRVELGRMREVVDQFESASASHRARLNELNADYDATREEFEAAFEEYDELRWWFRRPFLNCRDRLAAAATDAEWDVLVSSDSDR